MIGKGVTCSIDNNQGVNDMNRIKWMLIGVLACLVVGTLWWCGGKYGRCMWLGDVIVAGVAVSMTVLIGGIWWALARIAYELKRVADRLEQGAESITNNGLIRTNITPHRQGDNFNRNEVAHLDISQTNDV